MSHFYANLRGARQEITRTGTKSSGIVAHIRGWNVGCRVVINHDKDGNDVVTVYKTGGSNGRESEKIVAQFSDE